MAYENTEVSISKSQEGIRQIIYRHKGTGVIFSSQRPKEGFEALVRLRDRDYHIRVSALCKEPSRYSRGYRSRTDNQISEAWDKEERRVWRVLFHHLKAIFEAADADVLSIEEIIMPYVVTPDGKTLAEHILPRLDEIIAKPGNLLMA